MLRWAAVGLAVLVVAALAVVLPLVLGGGDPSAEDVPPAAAGRLKAETLYQEKFTVTAATGDSVVLNRTGAWNHPGPCADGGADAAASALLADCAERLEAAYETGTGEHRVDQQILVMKDAAAAEAVMRREDLGAMRLKAEAEGVVNTSSATRWDRVNNLVVVTTAGTRDWRSAAADVLSPALAKPVAEHVLGLVRAELGWKAS